MNSIGILTFHYSNNFGGVLQCYALYSYLKSQNLNVEVIDYVPSTYKGSSIFRCIGLRSALRGECLSVIAKRVGIKARYSKAISNKFDDFRRRNIRLSRRVNEQNINTILSEYSTIIVGSDQVWNPGRRTQKEYFLNFGDSYKGKKISYAADSTTARIDQDHVAILRRALSEFDHISVRNTHSQQFVEELIGKCVPVVVDPTLLWDFCEFSHNIMRNTNSEEYILVYVLGEDIDGSNKRAIDKIKQVYGSLKVYAIAIPTTKFNPPNYADRVFYDLGPEEWISMIRNAAFVYTDSYHGTLFSLKFHKPFLAYYVEQMRSTRFIDLTKRYNLDRFIVKSVKEIDCKDSVRNQPDFRAIDQLIKDHRETSIEYLYEALRCYVGKTDVTKR